MTQKQGQIHDCLKLGEDFELDLRAYQLRRAGRVLKLEPTPMELLLFLVQHRGELLGDKTKAKSAYQDFLTLWKDADPDIPILKQAKAEYTKLQ